MLSSILVAFPEIVPGVFRAEVGGTRGTMWSRRRLVGVVCALHRDGEDSVFGVNVKRVPVPSL